ncbi:MAG: tetratricopeptide repeat protein [Pyrinomonadaceae bacterium]|nr:tetratricopeptide repeat protein [Pyrinomonadaceae bacterium]
MKKRLVLAGFLLMLSSVAALAQAGLASADEIIKRGNQFYSRGEYEAAIKEYSRVPQGKTEAYAQSLYNTGVCYFELGRTEDAIKEYKRAIEVRAGNYPKALYALGVALEVSRRLDEAGEAYRQAIAQSDGKYTEAGFAVAHYRLALLAGREGAYEKAINLFRETIARSKERFPAGHNNLGVMLALAGRVQEAEREFEIALRQASDGFEDASYNLKLCRSLMMKDEAIASASMKVADATFVLTK